MEHRELSPVPCNNLEKWNGGTGGRFQSEGIYVYLRLFHVVVQQKPTQHCKAICYSITKSCPTLCESIVTSSFPVLHCLPGFAQIHVHWVSDASQPSHSLLPPFPALNLSQHQGLFQKSQLFLSGDPSTGASAKQLSSNQKYYPPTKDSFLKKRNRGKK